MDKSLVSLPAEQLVDREGPRSDDATPTLTPDFVLEAVQLHLNWIRPMQQVQKILCIRTSAHYTLAAGVGIRPRQASELRNIAIV